MVHSGYLNVPHCDEISILLPNDVPFKRDIILRNLDGNLKSISDLNPKYAILQYPLLFPYGDDTFHIDIKVAGQTKPISTREYYAYHIMVRTGTEHLLLSGRLFQQFIVDIFTKIESQRLNYHKEQLASKRICRYQTLVDQMEADETNASSLGQRIIL